MNLPTYQPGQQVIYNLNEPGGSRPRVLGDIGCIVLNAGTEYDLIISPAELADADNRECLEGMLRRCDVNLEDLREGAVYVLRNCQEHEIDVPF